MKNLLAENMLRFGTKGLSDKSKRRLVFESVMQTIREHGLESVVKKQLAEQWQNHLHGKTQPQTNMFMDIPIANAQKNYKKGTYKDAGNGMARVQAEFDSGGETAPADAAGYYGNPLPAGFTRGYFGQVGSPNNWKPQPAS